MAAVNGICNEDSGLQQRNPSGQLEKGQKSGRFFGESFDRTGSDSPWPSFDKFPLHLREGPWSPLAYIFLTAFMGFLVYSASWAYGGLGKIAGSDASSYGHLLHGAGALYTVLVHVRTFKTVGFWPYISYTGLSYVLLSLRYTFAFLGLQSAAEVLRFPVVVMASITTSVWWLVLFPIILSLAEPQHRKGFLKMNASFFLVNMHLLNLPLALATYFVDPRPLVFLDFWVAGVVAFAYLIFYVVVLDPNGLHLYIILSPRPWWCVVSYSGILLLYAQLFRALA